MQIKIKSVKEIKQLKTTRQCTQTILGMNLKSLIHKDYLHIPQICLHKYTKWICNSVREAEFDNKTKLYMVKLAKSKYKDEYYFPSDWIEII